MVPHVAKVVRDARGVNWGNWGWAHRDHRGLVRTGTVAYCSVPSSVNQILYLVQSCTNCLNHLHVMSSCQTPVTDSKYSAAVQ